MKSKKNSSSLTAILLILFSGLLVSVVFITTQGRSTFELRKRADEITPTVTPTPTPKNIIPTCLGLSVSPLSGKTPLELTLSCSGVDGNNDITAAEFGLGGDQKRTVEKSVGQYGTITTTARYNASGSYVVTCRVRDNNYEWSDIPSACSNTVNVSQSVTIVETPRPTQTPVPIEPTETPIVTQSAATPTATLAPLVPTSIPTPTPVLSNVSQEKFYMIGKIVLISIVTIMVGLLLKKLIDGNE